MSIDFPRSKYLKTDEFNKVYTAWLQESSNDVLLAAFMNSEEFKTLYVPRLESEAALLEAHTQELEA